MAALPPGGAERLEIRLQASWMDKEGQISLQLETAPDGSPGQNTTASPGVPASSAVALVLPTAGA